MSISLKTTIKQLIKQFKLLSLQQCEQVTWVNKPNKYLDYVSAFVEDQIDL